MEDPDPPVVPGRMWVLGLYKSVVLVLFLLRQNPVQEAAAELFGISQATVSRRWTALLPLVEKVLTGHVPDPAEASAGRIVLVDGTLVTTWDWASEGTTMFSGKHCDTGFNLQVAATLAGDLFAVSAPVPGSRHDMRARRQSDFPEALAEREGMGDLGYIGSGLITPRRKPPGQERSTGDKAVGAKRWISRSQFPSSEAGRTTRVAPAVASSSWRRRWRAIRVTVLPNPMSSARHTPRPSEVIRCSQFKPRS
ncbi:hypothetical protein BJY54_005770 [Streptomyces nodosus]|nr:hypothetical protein [Streptomyces nodosus]